MTTIPIYTTLMWDKRLQGKDAFVYAVLETLVNDAGYVGMNDKQLLLRIHPEATIYSLVNALERLEQHGFIHRRKGPALGNRWSRRIYLTYDAANDLVFCPIEGIRESVAVARKSC